MAGRRYMKAGLIEKVSWVLMVFYLGWVAFLFSPSGSLGYNWLHRSCNSVITLANGVITHATGLYVGCNQVRKNDLYITSSY